MDLLLGIGCCGVPAGDIQAFLVVLLGLTVTVAVAWRWLERRRRARLERWEER
ncbi:MAG: hypothetical protein H6674_10520 [Dehalococcoidia bacterium]|nr:hypothetical protein [Dehalococcoidia bacterium]MCB9508187.1 hypothetical protein [Myxococcales bacterium]